MSSTPLALRILRAVAVISAGVFLLAIPLRAEQKPGIKLERCPNTSPVCDTAHPSRWITGEFDVSDEKFRSGSSVPYRAIAGGLQIGVTYRIDIEWLAASNDTQVIDHLTSYDYTVSDADPCAGAGCGGSKDTLAVPLDSGPLSDAEVLSGQRFVLFGGRFVPDGTTVTNSGDLCETTTCVIGTNPSSYVRRWSSSGESITSTSVWIRPDHDSAVLAWGGRIASRVAVDTALHGTTGSVGVQSMRVVDMACSDLDDCHEDSTGVAMLKAVVVETTSTTDSSTSSTSSSTSTSTTVNPSTSTSTSTATSTTSSTSTSTSTSVASTTTATPTTSVSPTTAAPTTVAPGDLQVINPQGGEVEIVEDIFTVLIPEEIPTAGSNTENVLMIAGVLVLTGWFLATVAATRKPRQTQQEETQ